MDSTTKRQFQTDPIMDQNTNDNSSESSSSSSDDEDIVSQLLSTCSQERYTHQQQQQSLNRISPTRPTPQTSQHDKHGVVEINREVDVDQQTKLPLHIQENDKDDENHIAHPMEPSSRDLETVDDDDDKQKHSSATPSVPECQPKKDFVKETSQDHDQTIQIPEATKTITAKTLIRIPSASDTAPIQNTQIPFTDMETLPIHNQNICKETFFEQQQQSPNKSQEQEQVEENQEPSLLPIPNDITTTTADMAETKLSSEKADDLSSNRLDADEDGDHSSNSADHPPQQPQHEQLVPTSPSLNYEEDFLTEEEKVLLPLGASWSSEAFAWEYASHWLDDDETLPLENCFGVFHVKVLRAQRLSCPVGSSVQAILRLLPWKGKVRVEPRASSFSWLDRVCVQFPTNNHDTPYTSMVHSYSDETSPWPEIQIQLAFSPLLGMFEFTMATFHIPCQPLMRRPGIAKRQWFRSHDHHNNPRSPLVEVEAFFERIGHHPNVHNNRNGVFTATLHTSAASRLESTPWTSTVEEPKMESKNELPSPSAMMRKVAKHETAIPEEEDYSNSSLSFLKPPVEVVDVAGDMSSVDGSLLENVSTLLVQPPPASSPMDRSNTPIAKDEGDCQKEEVVIGQEVPENDAAVNNYTVKLSPMPPFSPSSHSIVPTTVDRSKLAIPAFSTAPMTSTGERKEDQKQPQHIIPAHHAGLRHLLRIKTYYTPATCCICRRSLMSGIWKTVALQCEVCKVDCCDDCRLQVDVQLPCGSEKAQNTVSQSLQHRWTLDKLLHAIAPFENTEEAAATSTEKESSPAQDGTFGLSSATIPPAERGIGTMRLHFIRAHILDEHLPPETDPLTIPDATHLRVRPGDYYVRVSWNGNSQSIFRTQTIMQSTGRPRLDSASGEMHFVVPHYGTEFKIECIDAITDKSIGSGLITTQGTLQEQRDYLIEEQKVPMLAFLRPLRFRGLRRKVIELRCGLKNGYSNEFFSLTKENSKNNESRAGDIVGCIELFVGMEEDIESLYGTSNPYECPARPGEELNMGVFQMHLVRLSAVVEELKAIGETYMYIVSWKNPFVTAFSLFLFIRIAARIDPAYIGSLPVLIVISIMIYKACKRSFGRSSQIFIQKEIENNRKLERGTVDYDIHRPVGLLQLTVASGRNVRSPELGLPGNVGCRVYWDPSRFMTEKLKERAVLIDNSLGAVHDIGSTNLDIGLNPAFWDNLPSNTAKRLKLLMPNHQDSFDKIADTSNEVSSFEFPVLQPIKKCDDTVCLESWNRSTGAVVIEVLFSDLLNLLPGSEYCVGEVVIPFSDLLRNGKLKGWFDIKAIDTGETVTPLKIPILSGKQDGDEIENPDSPKDEIPQIFLKASWVPPNENDAIPVETFREASMAIQEEMVKSAILKRDQKERLSLLGTSVEALNTVRGISANLQMVQNTLGSVLDVVESCLHAFDFMDPFKSFVVLGVLIVLWLVLSHVSSRAIIMSIGLAQYAINFKARFGHWVQARPILTTDEPSTKEEIAESESPFSTWIINALRGLPTSEDLRKTYFWESKRLGAQEMESFAAEKRKLRMRQLWKVQFYRTVRILTSEKSTDKYEWRTVFVILQGHRLLWWRSLSDFDNGECPIGRIFLAGHAGLASPSPLEMRKMNAEDLERVVCIFGSGARVVILAQSAEVKVELEQAVESAVSSKQD